MRLILDPAENVAHGHWLRHRPGAYEWWYFDAVSDDGQWILTCIWFLGNPFSPFYRLAALGRAPDPFEHNAFFFALYRSGALYAYHFNRFAPEAVTADESRPATLRFGPNVLSQPQAGVYRLQVTDENANRRTLRADLMFVGPLLRPQDTDGAGENHFWLPAAPACRVRGQISLREAQNAGAETVAFAGGGYHDHNWGSLPFDRTIQEWYWARAALGPERAAVVYHLRHHDRPPVSQLLLCDGGHCRVHAADVTLSRLRLNAFGTRYATSVTAGAGELSVRFHLDQRLDSAPFYIRTTCRADLQQSGGSEDGAGVGEYFRPRLLASALAAFGTAARIMPP